MRLFLTLILSSIALVSPAFAEQKLNLFTWSEYIDPAIIADFEKKFDCKVTVDLYEDNETLLAKMESGGSSVYNAVVPSDYILRALLSKQLLAPLRHENIPNMKNIAERFANPPYDRGNKHSVPFQWGTVGVYLRKDPKQPADLSDRSSSERTFSSRTVSSLRASR